MEWKKQVKILIYMLGSFIFLFYLPLGNPRFEHAILESLALTKWYAREHVILCLVPAFFIAGAISVFINQASVMKYLGAKAPKVLAYGVASVSGTILAVCSCTVLPMFAGIYKMGAGLGPATAFLYSGPAISVLAIILTARVLGLQLGAARALGAIVFSIIIGFLMALIFRREEKEKSESQMAMPEAEVKRPLWKNILYFASLLGILVFANWGKPLQENGFWYEVYSAKWVLTILSGLGLGVILVLWFGLRWWKLLLLILVPVISELIFVNHMFSFGLASAALVIVLLTEQGELKDWLNASWDFAKLIMPMLLVGVLGAGFFLGRPGEEGIIPSAWVSRLVGGNSLLANLFSSIVGAFMYFATLTEVPILQGLLGSGMGKGPALALLLAGPALSLPSMLVLRSVMGLKKTAVYVALVVVMATISGLIFGAIF